MTKTGKRIITLLSAAVAIPLIVICALCASVRTAYAADSGNAFDDTKAEDDLADIDLGFFEANYNDAAIAELVEYCYSDNAFRQGSYGVYLYVYNPKRIRFSIADGANTVNMATGYDSDGEPNAYENRALRYLGKTTGDNDGLVYKFKVAETKDILATQKEYNRTYGERRYDIAGIQLRAMGEALAEDYTVGGTWHYTGYAKGCGEDETAESTLACERTDLETVELDVHHTFWLPEGFNDPEVHTQDQLNTVYFAVPKRLKDLYGTLCRVQAEWYEYRTKPIFVMGDSAVYEHLKNYVGHVSDTKYDENIKYGMVANFHFSGPHEQYPMGDYIYNAMGMSAYETIEWLYELQYLFPASGSAGDEVISSEELLEYVRERSKYETDLLLGKYASCLFTDDVGEGRKPGSEGKTEVNMWGDETFDLTSTVISQSFWQSIFGGHTQTTTRYDGIEAIHEVTAEDMQGSVQDVCNRLFVNASDYAELKSVYDEAVTVDPTDPDDEEKIVYLFRFSVTDTYSAQVTYFEKDPLHTRKNNAYMAMQNVFLDFDIISLTYERNGEYTVIPAVADPIDIFADVTPPPDFEEDGLAWWQIALIVLGVALAVYIIVKIVRGLAGGNGGSVNITAYGDVTTKRGRTNHGRRRK